MNIESGIVLLYDFGFIFQVFLARFSSFPAPEDNEFITESLSENIESTQSVLGSNKTRMGQNKS